MRIQADPGEHRSVDQSGRSGAVDQYLVGTLGLRYRLGGGEDLRQLRSAANRAKGQD